VYRRGQPSSVKSAHHPKPFRDHGVIGAIQQALEGRRGLGPWSDMRAFAFGARLGASMNDPGKRMSAR